MADWKAVSFCVEISEQLNQEGKTQLGGQFNQLAHLAEKRLWHQLSVVLESTVTDPGLDQRLLMQIHSTILEAFVRDISPIKYVLLSIYIANYSQLPGAEHIAFLRKIAARSPVAADSQALVLAKSALATQLLSSHTSSSSSSSSSTPTACSDDGAASTSSRAVDDDNDDDDGGDQLAEVKQLIGEITKLHAKLRGAQSSVDAAYYKLLADYHLVAGPPEAFLDNGLMYLAFRDAADIPAAERRTFAVDLCLASLCGDKTYNFGQLLSHPILDALNGTSDAFLVSLLDAFNRGDIDCYNKISSAEESAMCAHPSLTRNAALLRRKIQILGVMELIFKRDRDQRVLSFQEVADATELPLDQVEGLVMKALSLKLIRGVIDQVDQQVKVTWVQPRVLTLDQIQAMRSRLDDWSERVRQTVLALESQSGDLMK